MYESIADEVIRYLKEYEMQNYSYCAFFDIDDTLIHSETQLPITSIVNVYNECKKLNICLFIITARTDSLFTYYQLYSVGIKGWGGIYFSQVIIFITKKQLLLLKKMLVLKRLIRVMFQFSLLEIKYGILERMEEGGFY